MCMEQSQHNDSETRYTCFYAQLILVSTDPYLRGKQLIEKNDR
jgi:hypothetical protein